MTRRHFEIGDNHVTSIGHSRIHKSGQRSVQRFEQTVLSHRRPFIYKISLVRGGLPPICLTINHGWSCSIDKKREDLRSSAHPRSGFFGNSTFTMVIDRCEETCSCKRINKECARDVCLSEECMLVEQYEVDLTPGRCQDIVITSIIES